jgi:hypothetical protein
MPSRPSRGHLADAPRSDGTSGGLTLQKERPDFAVPGHGFDAADSPLRALALVTAPQLARVQARRRTRADGIEIHYRRPGLAMTCRFIPCSCACRSAAAGPRRPGRWDQRAGVRRAQRCPAAYRWPDRVEWDHDRAAVTTLASAFRPACAYHSVKSANLAFAPGPVRDPEHLRYRRSGYDRPHACLDVEVLCLRLLVPHQATFAPS